MSEGDPRIGELLSLARAVSRKAYSPHSGLQVGAVVEDAQGHRYTGCNVETASYGLTQCAERNAMATAIAAGAEPGSLHTLLVYSTGFEILSPCGACRQVMVELMSAEATVISCSEDGEAQTWALSELFPNPFVLE